MTVEEKSIGNKRKITDFFSVSKKAKSEVNHVKSTQIVDKQPIEKSIEKSTEESTEKPINEVKFDKEKFIESLTIEEKYLLQLEIDTMEDSWFELLHKEFTKPYFLELKKFLIKEWASNKNIFPPKDEIYSWSRLTPLKNVKVLIIGQDPYHNFNQAHGLAFSVKDKKTRIPPSLVNIFKGIKNDYPEFQIPKNGDLTKWAKEGVLLLNTCLTVEAHKANSHSKHGWEQFTTAIIDELVKKSQCIVIIAWGRPAQQIVTKLKLNTSTKQRLYLYGAHPSPLSAFKGGFFNNGHFKKCNEWLAKNGKSGVVWQL